MSKRRAKPADRPGAGLVLDAGALRAIERLHVGVLVALRAAHRLNLTIRIPAAALAQVWRGGPRSAPLARLLQQPSVVVAIDELAARQVGELIGHVGRSDDLKVDVVDAHVALTTLATESLVLTSDPEDMQRYGVPAARIRKV